MNDMTTARLVPLERLRLRVRGVRFSHLFCWKGCPLAVAVLLLSPALFIGRPSLPRVIGGDEPHYLIIVNSLLFDGDLNLANNYASVHHGGIDAGRTLSETRFVEHHTRYALAEGSKNWWMFHTQSIEAADWTNPENGDIAPPLRSGLSPLPPAMPEYSTHQPGIALMTAPLLFPFRGTRWLEPMAILCSTFAVIGAFFFFRRLLRHMEAEESAINLVSGLAFLGTTVWFYGQSLFPEGMLLLCICGAYTLGICRGAAFLAGMFIGAAIQIKAYYLLFALPLGLDYLAHRQWRSALLYSAPIVASGLLFLVQNQIFFGDWRTSAQEFIPGAMSDGALGLLFSLKWGLLVFSPVVVVAIAFWPWFVRSHHREALLLGSVFLINFLLISCYRVWYGGNCVGPRYLVPFLPFLFVPLALKAHSPFAWRPSAKMIFAFLAILSIYANADATIRRARYWDTNPLVHYGHAALRKCLCFQR